MRVLLIALLAAISYAQTDPCAEIVAKYPECAEDYEGDVNCEPSQEDLDYLLENCDESDTNEVAVGKKKKKKYIPTPGKKEDNVPKPDDEVVRRVCVQYTEKLQSGQSVCKGKIGNPIPLGQQWTDKGQASTHGCCKLWTSACHWCTAPFAKLDQDPTKCYVKNGPGNGKCRGDGSDKWEEDTWGREHYESWDSFDQCMGRKQGYDQYCGTNSQWCFAHGNSTTCGGSEQRICFVDGCHGTMTNLIPFGEVWERVVHKKTEKGCCAFGNGACDLCRGHVSIQPGNQIFLRSQNTGKHIEVGDYVAKARYDDQGDWQKFTIEKDEPEGDDKMMAKMMPGVQHEDQIYLRAHTGMFLDEENDQVYARYDDHGELQRFTIYSADDQGPIYRGSTVYLKAANEKYVGVEGEEVKATYDDPQAFTIELKDFSQLEIASISSEQMRKGRRTCYKDNCFGTRSNSVRRGEQWIRTHQHSDRGCCALGRNACDWCVPPSGSCGENMAYHSGRMVDDNADANSDIQCRDACNAHRRCDFWDFGDGFCRLRSNDGGGAEPHNHYSYGTKFCYFESNEITTTTTNTAATVGDYVLLRSNVECGDNANEFNMGTFDSVDACAEACKSRVGCTNFIFGKMNKFGACWDEGITETACSTWETDEYDFYGFGTNNCEDFATSASQSQALGSGGCLVQYDGWNQDEYCGAYGRLTCDSDTWGQAYSACCPAYCGICSNSESAVAEEDVAAPNKDTSMTQSISETSSLNAVTQMLALLGLGSVLYGFYRSFVKVHDYNEVPDITEETFKA